MGRDKIHWLRSLTYQTDETDIVTEFELESSRAVIDITSLIDTHTRFIPGRLSGTCRIVIYSPTVDWIAMIGEDTVMVLPDQNDVTVVGTVTDVVYLVHTDGLPYIQVKLNVLELLV